MNLLKLIRNWFASRIIGLNDSEIERFEKEFEKELIKFIKLHSNKQEEKDDGK